MKACASILGVILPAAALIAADKPAYGSEHGHLGQNTAPSITGEKLADDLEEKEDGISFAFGIDFSSKQTTYGLIDNDDPILTPSASISYGDFSFEVAAIFDTTSVPVSVPVTPSATASMPTSTPWR